MSEFSHLKHKLLAEQVGDRIYHYIPDTSLNPGDRLPNEFELGERFGVGRSTIREAAKHHRRQSFIILIQIAQRGKLVFEAMMRTAPCLPLWGRQGAVRTLGRKRFKQRERQ